MKVSDAILARHTSATWPLADILTLVAEWEAGTPTSAIGTKIHKSKNSVVGKAHRLGLPSRPSPIKARYNERKKSGPAGRHVPSLPPLASAMLPERNANHALMWTPDLEAWLKYQVAAGRTNAEIGLALRCSGNAVVRKLDALVAGRPTLAKVTHASSAREAPPVLPSPKPASVVVIARQDPTEPVRTPIVPVVEALTPSPPFEPDPQPIFRKAPVLSAEVFMDASRQDSGCPWPIDNGNKPGRRYLFCGKPVVRGAYCEACGALSYQPRRERVPA